MEGKVYWITGLSGSGKTSIGSILFQELKKESNMVVFLDGDVMREYICSDLGYTLLERELCARRYSGLCKMLFLQGFTVICCTISMFHSVREWNRDNINNYIEVYVKASSDTLQERNQKGMYTGNQKNMMGIDLTTEFPRNPHIILENDEGDIQFLVEKILEC